MKKIDLYWQTLSMVSNVYFRAFIYHLYKKVTPSFFAIVRTDWSENTKVFSWQIRRYENNWPLLTDSLVQQDPNVKCFFFRAFIFNLYIKVIPSFFATFRTAWSKNTKTFFVKSDDMKIIDLYWQQDPWPRWTETAGAYNSNSNANT